MTRRAVIDVGTNTVKLLVADIEDGSVQPLLHLDSTTRLGEGVNRTHRLTPAAITRTVAAIRHYVDEARQLGAVEILALTTSATRSATNADDFLRACPLPVEVIAGDREAELIFRGAASDPLWAGQPLLVMDVGGGSAEWIRGNPNGIEHALSLPVGAVRLHEQFGDDFAGLAGHLRQTFANHLGPFHHGTRRMIATGGSAVTLAAIAQRQVDHAILSVDTIRQLVTDLNALPMADRRRVPGLPPERADIIVAGGAVFLFAMEALGAKEFTVSVRALRYGALLT